MKAAKDKLHSDKHSAAMAMVTPTEKRNVPVKNERAHRTPEEIQQAKREYYLKNKEKLAAYQREYQAKRNATLPPKPPKIKKTADPAAYRRAYYLANKEKIDNARRKHYQDSKAEKRELSEALKERKNYVKRSFGA